MKTAPAAPRKSAAKPTLRTRYTIAPSGIILCSLMERKPGERDEDTAARVLRDLADYMGRNQLALVPLPDGSADFAAL